MMIMDHQSHIIILYSDGETICMITGIQVTTITIIYGDEQGIAQIIVDEQMKQILKKDNDHVQQIIMFLVHENGDY